MFIFLADIPPSPTPEEEKAPSPPPVPALKAELEPVPTEVRAYRGDELVLSDSMGIIQPLFRCEGARPVCLSSPSHHPAWKNPPYSPIHSFSRWLFKLLLFCWRSAAFSFLLFSLSNGSYELWLVLERSSLWISASGPEMKPETRGIQPRIAAKLLRKGGGLWLARINLWAEKTHVVVLKAQPFVAAGAPMS